MYYSQHEWPCCMGYTNSTWRLEMACETLEFYRAISEAIVKINLFKMRKSKLKLHVQPLNAQYFFCVFFMSVFSSWNIFAGSSQEENMFVFVQVKNC